MGGLRAYLDRQSRHFGPGGRLRLLRPLWEAADTFLYTPANVTRGSAHVRDGMDLKRMMITVVIALIPCVLWGMYNTGLQANLALDPARAAELAGWRHEVIRWLGVGYSPHSVPACMAHGALYFIPLYLVTMAVGLAWEVGFAMIRRHEVNEGFFVTGLIFPLILPPTTPLWQAAFGISWGVVIAKEVFGGTGMNFLNPALVARACLFYSFPLQITGDKVWTAVAESHWLDGRSGATVMATFKQAGAGAVPDISWWDAFLGFELGSLGETSAAACLIGAAILLWTRVAAWRTVAGVVLGTVAAATLLNWIGSDTNPMFALPFWWHMVLGGWAFGTVFMVTDPVTSAFTDRGKWIYGALVGALIVLVRVFNPAYTESVMLVILFMNVFAPLIDHFVVRANIRRRLRRSEN
ncbi:MAG TPA: NADH:ubiquinone reductase (Na(+)-transporting) subunit B [Burkholderiales bacterium]|nr:NADH:ubiquinone reductase (Na(+)-transporting) subunit B [Burkholderiales bacterium]